MGASITFNVDKLIKEIDLIQKSHLPKAAEQALKSLGFDLREVLQKEWRQVPLSRNEKAGCSSPPRNPASTQIKSF